MVGTSRLRAYVRLHVAEGIGAILFHRMVSRFGDPEGVFAASRAQWMSVEGIGEKTARAISAVTDEQVDEELAEAERRGVRIVCLEDEAYPASLKSIHDPPAVLYVRGHIEATDAVALGVVGSRRCTHYGLEQAQRFGELLGRAGFTVVSTGSLSSTTTRV